MFWLRFCNQALFSHLFQSLSNTCSSMVRPGTSITNGAAVILFGGDHPKQNVVTEPLTVSDGGAAIWTVTKFTIS